MSNIILDVQDVSKHFIGLKAIDKVSLQIEEGQAFGLIGPNGAGKTTLINLITGHLSLTAGDVYFENHKISGLKPFQIGQLGISRTFQIVKPFKNLKVIDNVRIGSLFGKNQHPLKESLGIAEEILEFTKLYEKRNNYCDELTLGQTKRLELARALAMDPRLLLLDEVMAGLNLSEINDALVILEKIREKGITLFIVEHIMKVIMTVSDVVAVIHHGQKIGQGTPEEIVNDDKVIEAYLGEKYAKSKRESC